MKKVELDISAIVPPYWQTMKTFNGSPDWFLGLTTHQKVVICKAVLDNDSLGSYFEYTDGVCYFRLVGWQPLDKPKSSRLSFGQKTLNWLLESR